MPSSPLSYGHHPSEFAPSEAPSLDNCRLPSHLGKLSKLVCTRFGVSYLDILDFCFLEYHNVILSFRILIGVRLLSLFVKFSISMYLCFQLYTNPTCGNSTDRLLILLNAFHLTSDQFVERILKIQCIAH